jgi:hypothetical protein
MAVVVVPTYLARALRQALTGNQLHQMFKIIRDMILGANCGRAFARFAAGRFAEAAAILEKVLEKQSPDGEDTKYLLSMLGRSYARQGKFEKALPPLERSFHLYQICSRATWRPKDIETFEETAMEYSQVLRAIGESSQAEAIEAEVKQQAS